MLCNVRCSPHVLRAITKNEDGREDSDMVGEFPNLNNVVYFKLNR